MDISIQWLRQYVDIKESPEELIHMLSMLGLEAEIPDGPSFSGVIVGHVLKAEKHPNADRLKLCIVSDGNESFQVVCGAPNVSEGQKVPFAKVGAVLGKDFKITKAKIRGENSFGMICSEQELNLSDVHEGIMVLDNDAVLGTDFNDYLGKKDLIEIDLTPNRPDCMSHFGVAREIAVKTGRELQPIIFNQKNIPSNEVDQILKIQIDDPMDCPRYVAGVVKNIHVGPSPDWMKSALESVGQRSINNIVDISNYILLAMGHPTHIFDYDKIPSKTILIRKALHHEKIKTLDGVERELFNQLLITNGTKPIAIAGVMGGDETAVSDLTKNVLIESAYFNPVTIRLGSKSLGMSTDASKRFERGADPEGAMNAFWLAVELLEKYAGGEWIPGVIDAYPDKQTQPEVLLTRKKFDIISGIELSDDEITRMLRSLNIDVTQKNGGSWICIPPSFRPDLEREVDLIEELCRVYGYDHIHTSFHYNGLYDLGNIDPENGLIPITNVLKGLGFHQCFVNSLTNEKTSFLMGDHPVSMKNPLSRSMSHMRTSLYPGLLQSLNQNIHNGYRNVRVYEIGKIYNHKKKYKEILHLSGIMHGDFQNEDIHGNSIQHSFFTLKGFIEAFFSQLNLNPLCFKTGNHKDFEYGTSILFNNMDIGYCGKLKNAILKELNSDAQNVYGFNMKLKPILNAMEFSVKYQSIIPFPKVERDLNFVMDNQIEAMDVISLIKGAAGKYFLSASPKNIFKHESLGNNQKSITFNLVFQSPSKTLEEEEINTVINDITAIVKKEFNAKLRA